MGIKKTLREELQIHKRQTIANLIIKKASNNLFDAFREIEMALQYCDDEDLSNELEEIKVLLGDSTQTSGAFVDSRDTVISKLQDLMVKYFAD